ncbi:uncharacterized protein LOC141641399 [Silene latifolia]|uniref:uncharacterized protein LOC141641399 n=1 Tax=Silene latifolia TaxID=37657 RepID=UPI003D770D14
MIYPDFADEPRNVRLGLCTDGFSPFDQFGKPYSCWPVMVTPYNLPPWLCLKKQFIFLSLIIPGPKNPKSNLDVYLQPLVEELKHLWNVGVERYDVSKKQNFQLRASLLWTINDFPAYGMLSGWSTAGQKACPCCMEESKAFYLPNYKKISWFDCHRHFLSERHGHRRNKKAFLKGKEVRDDAPDRLPGDEVWELICDFPTTVDEGKSCDTIAARKDIKKFCDRPKLHIRKDGSKPKSIFTLDKAQRKVLCEWVRKLKFPDGYASDFKRCVDMKKSKLQETKAKYLNIDKEDEIDASLPEFFQTHDDEGCSTIGGTRYLDDKEYNRAHLYVLSNCEILEPYEMQFVTDFMKEHSNVRRDDVWNKHEEQLPSWFKKHVIELNIEDDLIKSLAYGPSRMVRTWNRYLVNGFNFHTFNYGKNKATCNYGVTISSLDGNDYYGIVEEIFEMCYNGRERAYKTVLFKVEWKDNSIAGTRMAGGRAGRGRQRGGGSQRRSTSSLEEEETEIERASVEESTNDDSSDQGPEIQWTNDGKMILDPAGLW